MAGMKFTKLPTDTFKNIQLNAGVLLTTFNPEDGTIDPSNIFGATTGGCNFTAVPTFIDFGEDIDNCPNNTMELKQIQDYEVKLAGTLVTVNTEVSKALIGAADISQNKVTPRQVLTSEDFMDLWWVGDYSDEHGETNGGFIAIKMMNVLSTGGFAIQSTKNGKGQFAFEATAHYSIAAQDTVPFEIHVKTGSAEA